MNNNDRKRTIDKKNIFAIIGSAAENSSNLKLVKALAHITEDKFNLTVFDNLRELPHFSPELSIGKAPKIILDFRESINRADGLLICTPEYVFSIPSGLKNAIEWCVSTIVFSNKPTGLITASADGKKGHEELQLIMKTVEAKFTEQSTLLIQGIKGKINEQGTITDSKTNLDFMTFIEAFEELFKNSGDTKNIDAVEV
ncbi:NAD(P)H-dependent oxidoreductase [Ginsengibacter hankyongi]|uniref:NAD(P)H-dependent oxidoreductase n=2 Tax=Ginsengibacter hankyongi TaxID=2607284 RepID=A0A5J5IG64_9BACT|nr:NAD(P)H-dependent oxidoreductase [Ginsengibacter hankyongi]